MFSSLAFRRCDDDYIIISQATQGGAFWLVTQVEDVCLSMIGILTRAFQTRKRGTVHLDVMCKFMVDTLNAVILTLIMMRHMDDGDDDYYFHLPKE